MSLIDDALVRDIEALAVAAGAEILRIYHRDRDRDHGGGSDPFEVVKKADDSPLTAADTASHRAIVAGLRARTPDIPILSEESADVPWAERSGWRRYWLVDPLDGTKEFIKRNGEFTVNIALIEDGVATLGVVGVPVADTVYAGVAGRGAHKRISAGDAVPISTRRAPEQGLVVSVSRSHPSDALTQLLSHLPGCETRPLGSALKLCHVAEGAVDVYPRLGPTSEWDTAAAQAVVEAAGGLVTRTDGTPLLYGRKESLLNPHFLVLGDPALLPRIRAALAEA
ncbi:3'(2'),5'-bisphosphate nucleotidase CysQ [Haliangium sp.]|uniref:3'(2'),5'-bisphosphate nucleotidase CysQ n=1 Tax=Haliangium sp. TaxID=2663208 RepID=UPI003D0D96AB